MGFAGWMAMMEDLEEELAEEKRKQEEDRKRRHKEFERKCQERRDALWNKTLESGQREIEIEKALEYEQFVDWCEYSSQDLDDMDEEIYNELRRKRLEEQDEYIIVDDYDVYDEF